MITLYTWTTPNGRKVPIMLEELDLDYRIEPVNLGKGEQHSPSFLALSPNNKIPALVDDAAADGPVVVFESGAILTYLAETHGRFLPASGPSRWRTLEWLHWQVGGLGPMLGQLGYFAVRAPEKTPPAIEHFTKEADRLLGVLDRRLGEAEHLGGDAYSIADIAAYPWIQAATTFLAEPLKESLAAKANLHRWLNTVGERPAVQRGMQLPKV